MTEAEKQRAISRSFPLRLRRKDSLWLINRGLEFARFADPGHEKKQTQDYLRVLVREKYGNPVVVWVLLNLVVPVVVKLIIEWWMRESHS